MPDVTLRRRVRSGTGRPSNESGRFDNENTDSDVVLNARGFVDDNPADGLSGELLMFHANKIAHEYGRRFRMTTSQVEEIRQDALVSLLKSQRDNPSMQIHGGLVRTKIRQRVSTLMDAHKSHTDSEGYTLLKRNIEAIQHAEHRMVGKHEQKLMAQQMLADDTEDHPRNHLSKGFENPARLESYDDPDSRFAESHPAREPDEARPSDEDGHVLVDRLEGEEGFGLKAARRMAWNALAKIAGAPAATVGTVNKATARAASKTITDAADVAERWTIDTTTVTEEEAHAFFLPYGMATDKQKDAVATMIADRPTVGHALWTAALECANEASY